MYFTIPRIPPEYLGAFRANGYQSRAIDFRMLPERIGRELAVCVWRIIELGGLVPDDPLDRLARQLSTVLEALPAGERTRRTLLMAVPATTWIGSCCPRTLAPTGASRAQAANTTSP